MIKRPDHFAAARVAALGMADTPLDRTKIGAALALFIDTLRETHEVVPRHLFEAIVDDSTAYRKTLITDEDRAWATTVAKTLAPLSSAEVHAAPTSPDEAPGE